MEEVVFLRRSVGMENPKSVGCASGDIETYCYLIQEYLTNLKV